MKRMNIMCYNTNLEKKTFYSLKHFFAYTLIKISYVFPKIQNDLTKKTMCTIVNFK